MSTHPTCPTCSSSQWRVRSSHRSLDGIVRYLSCDCGETLLTIEPWDSVHGTARPPIRRAPAA